MKFSAQLPRTQFLKVGVIGLILASLLLLRAGGGLQWLEWLALDILFQLRPVEAPDERLVLVGLTEADIRNLKTSQLSDRQLAELIRRIERGKPAAIGLDFFRDQPVGEGREELLAAFRAMPHLYGIGKQGGIEGDPTFGPIDPPPLAAEQVADVAVQEDGDGILRRLFLYPTLRPAVPSLGLALAYEYLAARGLEPEEGKDGWLKLGQVTFFPFSNPSGPYTQSGDGSYQLFPNWRKSEFPFVAVSEVLAGRVPPQQFRGKIAIIGSYAPSKKDQFLTPFSRSWRGTTRSMHGMEVQAQLASVVVSQALGERPLVFFWNEPGISLWVVAWGAATAIFLSHCRRQWLKIALFLGTSSAILASLSFLAFLQAVWLPLVPALTGIWGMGLVLSLWDYEEGRRDDHQTIKRLNQKLKDKIEQRQVYRDLAALQNDVTHRLVAPLQNLLNAPSIIAKKERKLLEKLQEYIPDADLRVEAVQSLGNLTAFCQKQAEEVDDICLKIATYFPEFDLPFLRTDWPVENRPVAIFLEGAIKNAINSLRPLIFKEYGWDVWDLLTCHFERAGEIEITRPEKLIGLFNRMIDEVLLKCQMEDISYPRLKIATHSLEEKVQIEIEIDLSYQPQTLVRHFCQEIAAYYQGQVSVRQSDGETIWTISLPFGVGVKALV